MAARFFGGESVEQRMSLRASAHTGVAIRFPLAPPYGRGAPEGAERACFTLSVGFAASSPKVGAQEERIVTGGSCTETFCESWNIRIGLQFTGR